MLGHFKKSASILTNQETQIVGIDQWLATICNIAEKNIFVHFFINFLLLLIFQILVYFYVKTAPPEKSHPLFAQQPPSL